MAAVESHLMNSPLIMKRNSSKPNVSKQRSKRKSKKKQQQQQQQQQAIELVTLTIIKTKGR